MENKGNIQQRLRGKRDQKKLDTPPKKKTHKNKINQKRLRNKQQREERRGKGKQQKKYTQGPKFAMLHMVIRHRNQTFLDPHRSRSFRGKRMLRSPNVFCYFPAPLAIGHSNTSTGVYTDQSQLRTCSDSLEKKGPASCGRRQNSRYRAMRINPLFPPHRGNQGLQRCQDLHPSNYDSETLEPCS